MKDAARLLILFLSTGKLGSYVGEHCYICEDTEPFTDSLDVRMRRLIQMSDAWGGLRHQLAELQRAIGEAGAAHDSEIVREMWRAVDAEVCQPVALTH